MRKLLRWLGRIAAGLLVLALLFAAWVWIVSARMIGRTHEGVAERIVRPAAFQVAEGNRRLHIFGCFGCHGAGLRGEMFLDEPGIAHLWAPNLTEVASRATDQQLARAIRQGIGVDGRALWVMPSYMYARLSDEDLGLVIATIRAQPRGGVRSPALAVGALGRLGIATGKFTPTIVDMEDYRVRQPWDFGPAQAAGRYLANTACSECHGPDLGGAGEIEGQVPPDLAIVGAYSPEQFRTLMRTGRSPSGRDLGLMGEVARGRFVNFTDPEVDALYSYLVARAERVSR